MAKKVLKAVSKEIKLDENRRILLVDDQASIHEDFRRILQTTPVNSSVLDEMEAALFGSEVSDTVHPTFDLASAYQGSEAVESVKQSLTNATPFAMAFVDVRMPPGMDGIETIEAIWALDPNIQIVICTAFSDYSWEDTIGKLGQTDQLLILKKPFDIIEVIQLACALVAKWNLSRQARLNQEQLETMVERRTLQLSAQTEKLKQTVKALKNAKIQLFQADKLASIGQLAAGLAHEINNPIGYVSCNLNTLNQYLQDLHEFIALQHKIEQHQGDLPKLDKDIEHIKQLENKIDIDFILEDIKDLMKDSIEGIDRVARIVGDLSDFSHVNMPEKAPVNINELIEKTLSVASNQIKEKAIIAKNFETLPEIVLNGGQIGQVILNLLINACQAIEGNGRITVSTRANEEFLFISIEDTGVGIPEKVQHKIFDPFFTSKPIGVGTGLGLHIAHNIIAQHQGSICFQSKVGEGTCFTLKFPVSSSEPSMHSNIA